MDKVLNTEFAKLIHSKIAGLSLSDDLYTRRIYSKDLWPRKLIEAREAELVDPWADLVAWPANIAEIVALVKLANESKIELFAYGAGSGVCGAIDSVKGPNAAKKIVVDLKKLDQIESIDEVSGIAKVQVGMIGQVLEETLNQKGFTLGHFPSSIYCSAFGGYLATRAAGQLSTYYGKIEDMVLGLEGVLPDGATFKTTVTPRMALGPDWNHIFLGSEGSLAFLTSAFVKVHRLPESRAFLSYVVASTAQALEGVRQWMQVGLRPAVVRIYDEDESKLLMGIKEGVKLIAVIEGEKDLVDFTLAKMKKMVSSDLGWHDLGEEPAQHWWSHRYDVSYRQQQIMSHRRMILDTFEVSTSWSNLNNLYLAVKKVADKFKKSSDQFLIILAHFSHFYHCGANIYFTFCGRAEDGKTLSFYDEVWDELLSTCIAQGAAISHHHGIGRLKAARLQEQQGVLHNYLRKIKNELDKNAIFNPKNLGL